ncbi:cbb3-type cytochrome c oxidase subunit I, partial [Streptomyces sp. NPDC001215]
MPQLSERTAAAWRRTTAASSLGGALLRWTTTTDHKVIGRLYMVTSFCFFLFAGLLALGMRAELARPGLQFLSEEGYNQFFTVHGTVMMLLFATPMFAGAGGAAVRFRRG